MFGRKSKRTQKREEHQKALREGLIFWLPGGSSRIDVYLDYCVIRCLGKTKMKEKEREIPFTSIRDVIYTPATVSRTASLQLITKEMPDVKRSYWYAYENNLVVVHPGNETLAQKIRAFQLLEVSSMAAAMGTTSRKYSPSTLGFAKVEYTRKSKENREVSVQTLV